MLFRLLSRQPGARGRLPLAFPSFPSFLALTALLLVGLAAAAWAVAPTTVLVTRGFNGGGVGKRASAEAAAISADGRWVAFVSDATNFTSIAPSNKRNIFAKNSATGAVELVSVGVGGAPANGDCGMPSISADGRYVAFHSKANNLVPGDTNVSYDIFVRDLTTGTTTRASVGPGGVEADGVSVNPSLSADGRYVAFSSTANNLVPPDRYGWSDIFVRDLATGITKKANVPVNAPEAIHSSYASSISADGRLVAFASDSDNLVSSDTNFKSDIFVRNMSTNVTTRINLGVGGAQANGHSYAASISADGRYIAYLSEASNLVPGDTDHRPFLDLYMHDRSTGSTTRASALRADPNSFNAPSLSADGRYLAFTSDAGNSGDTRDIFVLDRSTGRLTQANLRPDGEEANHDCLFPALSADGRYITFHSKANNLVPGDTGNSSDIFLRDLSLGAITRVSVGLEGEEGIVPAALYGSAISADGRWVAFDSDGANLVADDRNEVRDVFVRNLATGITTLVTTPANAPSEKTTPHTPSFSADGRYVAFESDARALVPGDSNGRDQIFLRDLSTGVITRASVGPGGVQANADCFDPSLSADGRYVAFQSAASNLVAGGQTGGPNIYVRDRVTDTTIRAGVGLGGAQPNSDCFAPSLSANGRYVAFQSLASNLVVGDTNGWFDIFVRDLATGSTTRASLGAGGAQPNSNCIASSMSADGRYVAFQSNATNLVAGDTNGQFDIFVRDLVQGTTIRASLGAGGVQANRESFRASMNGDGRFVAFDSLASNLVSGDTNNSRDIFVRDLATGVTARASVGPGGIQANGPSSSASISANGRVLSYHSTASNLTDDVTNGVVNVFVTTLPPLPPMPGAPTSLTAVAAASRRVNLAWADHSTGESGFEIWTSLNGVPFSLMATVPANQSTYLHVGPEGNHTLHYKVRAVTASSQTAFSNVATAILMAQPLGLTAKALNSTTIDVRWNDKATNEGSYEVWRAVGGGAFTLLATKYPGAIQHTDTVPAGNQTYSYKVCCRNGVHLSSFSNQDPAFAMRAPSGLSATAEASARVKLTWTDNSGTLETGFQIYRRTSATGGQTQVGTAGANATSFTDSTVLLGRPYWYEVRAVNGPDLSHFSNLQVVTTP